MRRRHTVDIEAAKEIVRYNPKTGSFRWLRKGKRGSRNMRRQAGTIEQFGYRRIWILGVNLPAHRLAWAFMTGRWPVDEIDHINGKRADNRWCNLREATRAQNAANQKQHKDITHLKGAVPICGREDYWTAHLRRERLGSFKTEQEAHAAYMKRAREVYGEFARAR